MGDPLERLADEVTRLRHEVRNYAQEVVAVTTRTEGFDSLHGEVMDLGKKVASLETAMADLVKIKVGVLLAIVAGLVSAILSAVRLGGK